MELTTWTALLPVLRRADMPTETKLLICWLRILGGTWSGTPTQGAADLGTSERSFRRWVAAAERAGVLIRAGGKTWGIDLRTSSTMTEPATSLPEAAPAAAPPPATAANHPDPAFSAKVAEFKAQVEAKRAAAATSPAARGRPYSCTEQLQPYSYTAASVTTPTAIKEAINGLMKGAIRTGTEFVAELESLEKQVSDLFPGVYPTVRRRWTQAIHSGAIGPGELRWAMAEAARRTAGKPEDERSRYLIFLMKKTPAELRALAAGRGGRGRR